jgi:DNA-binding MarR family transcriptional regulator
MPPAAALRQQTESADLADRLRPALMRVSRYLRREAQRAGVSALDALLLGSIKKNPGVSASELADREHMTRPTMSGHVKRLERSGWIARAAPTGEDRRRISLIITRKGERALEEIRKHRNDWLALRLSALPPRALAQLEAAIEPLLALAREEA